METLKTFRLIKAPLSDLLILENLWHYYVYDLSRYCGNLPRWESPTEISFKCDDLSHYFTDQDSHVFFIMIAAAHAGFVIVNKLDSLPKSDWYLSEFFIISRFQHLGIGQQVAKDIFDQFSGKWAVGILPENTPALKFWRKVIGALTNGNFHEEHKSSEQLKTKNHPDPYPMLMIEFNI